MARITYKKNNSWNSEYCGIEDTAVTTNEKTWSVNKIKSEIEEAAGEAVDHNSYPTVSSIPFMGTGISEAKAKLFGGSNPYYQTECVRAFRCYSAMRTEVGSSTDKVPFFATADNHRMFPKHLYNMLGALVYWADISAFINLGDICSDSSTYLGGDDFANYGDIFKYNSPSPSAGNRWYNSNSYDLSSYVDAVKPIPLAKRIDVWGNHDIWRGSNTEANVTTGQGVNPDYILAHLPTSQYATVGKNKNNKCNGWYTFEDSKHNVKYIIFNSFSYDVARSGVGNESVLSKEQADFIISELAKADGLDVILVNHKPVWENFVGTSTSAGGITYTGQFTLPNTREETGDAEKDFMWNIGNTKASNLDDMFSRSPTMKDFVEMLQARRNKTSGTLVDDERHSHSYDFSGCDSDIICMLSGHSHHEKAEHFSDILTNLVLGSYRYCGVNLSKTTLHPFYCGYIDKTNRVIKVWRSCDFGSTSEKDDKDINNGNVINTNPITINLE